MVPPDPEPPPESPTPRVLPPDDDMVDGNVADRTPNRSASKAPWEQSDPQWERDDKQRLKRKSVNFSKMSQKQMYHHPRHGIEAPQREEL